jgi:hypothetical protein
MIMCEIIGRKKEIAELKRYYESGRAEFVAVYGRRRVGKTFLIDEVFHDDMVFHHTGLSPYDRRRKVTLKDQLQNFYFSLLRHGMEDIAQPKSWMEAFFLLERFLETCDNGSRQVVFIDELPWMDTARSGFLTALEAFWNGWGNMRHNLLLVVCGSATSWMLDNLISNKGGLYGRLTGEIKLSPFSLKECEEFYQSRGIRMSRYNITQAYMIMGGIPFYMNFFNPSYSLAQNIDALFFDRQAKLGDEFDRLFNSVFDHAEDCMKIVRFLGTRQCLCRRHGQGAGTPARIATEEPATPARQSGVPEPAAKPAAKGESTPQAAGQRCQPGRHQPARAGRRDQAADATATGQPGAGCRTATRSRPPGCLRTEWR